MKSRRMPIVLIAEHSPGDRVLLHEAFHTADIKVDLRLVADGAELLDYLHRRSPWQAAERPDLVLLDPRTPRMNGCGALREIKADPQLSSIPVIVLSSSRAHDDVANAYANGANTYIAKPASPDALLGVIQGLYEFWFKVCVTPRTVKQ